MSIKHQTDLFEEYSKVRHALNRLTERERIVKAEILKGLDKTEKSGYGIFTPVERYTYKYTKHTLDYEKSVKKQIKDYQEMKMVEVKLKQKQDIDSGRAEEIITKTMQFRGVK